MLRDDQWLAQDVFESSRDALVCGYAPLEHDTIANLSGAHHLFQVVVDNGVREPCRQIAKAVPRLLVVNEV